MLHTINKSPYSHDCLRDCLRICGAQAAILLIEDGVYAALADSAPLAQLNAAVSAIYALAPDVAARGLEGRVGNSVKLIDYAGFVQLCCEHNAVHSWF
jgi:tRNA 2-thiouridine synthesizing protein B